MKALLSIKPRYVKHILDGTKRFEYRRRAFARKDVNSIAIYATHPISAVVAEVGVKAIIAGSPRSLWNKTKGFSGISSREFFSYFQGSPIAYAIELGEIRCFSEPELLSNYCPRLSHPPQSFVYIDDESSLQKDNCPN